MVVPAKAPGRTRKKAVRAAAAGAGDGMDMGGVDMGGVDMGGVNLLDNAVPAPPPAMAKPPAGVADNDDPNKGQFGGRRERDGFRVSGEVSAMPQSTDVFLIHVAVEASAGRPPLLDGTAVVFHLHPTFGPEPVTVPASGGVATLDRLAWGSFTVGVAVQGVRLELDLASKKDVPDAPPLFRER
jgi:hypothetical protein